MERKYLRAGEFGAAGRLSPKALRRYAEQGLLVPASVDPAAGYRYYGPDQLPRARLIAPYEIHPGAGARFDVAYPVSC